MTTNDMPIIDPLGFDALNLIPFQINPHYLDKKVEGHGGESREDRILEFIEVNRDVYVAGLREGCMFVVEDNKMKIIGKRNLRLFKYGTETREIEPTEDFSFLLEKMV
jgi:dipeptidase E